MGVLNRTVIEPVPVKSPPRMRRYFARANWLPRFSSQCIYGKSLLSECSESTRYTCLPTGTGLKLGLAFLLSFSLVHLPAGAGRCGGGRCELNQQSDVDEPADKSVSFPGAREYHVQFFSNQPERAWVHEKRVREYKGHKQYEQLLAEAAKQASNHSEKQKVWQHWLCGGLSAVPVAVTVPWGRSEAQ